MDEVDTIRFVTNKVGVDMTKEGQAVTRRILAEVSGFKYFYRSTVAAAFETCVNHYKMTKPSELKDEIIDEVLRVMKEIRDNNL
jgi:hypothetical protein